MCKQAGEQLQLRFTVERIELFDRELDTSIDVDFVNGAIAHREKFGGGKGQAIAKAIGLNRYDAPSVLDVTAGLGRDAWVLASLGCHMTLLERSPVLHCLLEDGLERARLAQSSGAIECIDGLVLADSTEYLSTEGVAAPDVIYMDPMYPQRQKSAKVKKDMQILHKLIGDTADESRLLDAALERAGKRVVVKRPVHADSIEGHTPSHQVRSKKTRYDVYMTGNSS